MKMTKNLQSASAKPADSQLTKAASNNPPKQKQLKKIQLNVGRAEKALLRRARKKDRERVRRGPLERMFKIHEIINEGMFPNAMALAFELEVGHKTICRDIEYMRDHFMFPIEYDAAQRGYFYSSPVDGFPGAPGMTESEMSALLVGHKALAQYQGTPFPRRLQMTCEKLTRQLDSKDRCALEDASEAVSFRPFAPEDTDLRLFKTMTDARRDRKVLQFLYRKPGEKVAQKRLVHPYDLICSDNRWYLFGYDEDRAGIRIFAFARIQSPEVTDDRFTKRRDFTPEKYLRNSFAIMSGTGDYEVIIDFDAWATDLLRGRLWHVTQKVTELPDGASRMTMRLSGLEEIERWILSWGIHATVIGPLDLVKRIGAIATAVAARHPLE